MNEEQVLLSAEEFVETGSNKIIQELCKSGDVNAYKWAVKFLHRTARGFGDVQHEPWIGPLTLRECSEIILINCKSYLQNSCIEVGCLNSALRLLLKSSLPIDVFVSELVTIILDENDLSSEEIIEDAFLQRSLTAQDKQIHGNKPLMEMITITSNYSDRLCLKRLPPDTEIELNGENSNVKRRKMYQKHLQINHDEVKDFVDNIWMWVKNGRIKLAPGVIGRLLSFLPERVEESIIDMALEVMKNSSTRKKLVADLDDDSGGNRTRKCSYSETSIVDSVLQDNDLLIEAAASSSKLFQICSSVLNQLLIQSAGCADAWSSLLTLCSAFARETAKGRASHYPLALQTAVFLMEMDPEGICSEKHKKDFIRNHLKSIWKTLPPEATVALLSHFPQWLTYADPVSLLH